MSPSEYRRGQSEPAGHPAATHPPEERPAPEELELLAGVHRQDDASFARLYEQQWPVVWRLLIRFLGDADLAGDVAQEVFVQLYRRPPQTVQPSLRAWLCRVALNRGHNALRATRRRRRREDASVDRTAPASDELLAQTLNLNDERDAVRRTLLRLTERQRDCLTLRAEGLSYVEIAAVLGLAPGSVGTVLARAERAFRDAFVAQQGGL